MAMAQLLWFLAVGAFIVQCGHAAEVSNTKAEKHEATEEVENGSVVLLGLVALLMMTYYLVNSTRASVRDHTWSIVSTSISIFIAVMTNILINELVNVLSGSKESEEEEAPLGGQVVVYFTYLVCWLIASLVCLYMYKDSELRLLGYGTVYGHILGFAAICAYGNGLASMEAFSTSPRMTLLAVGIYLVTMPLFTLPTCFIGNKFCKHPKLHDQAKESGTDMFAMGLSFLIGMFFRSWIKFARTGKAAGVEAVGTGHQIQEIGTLVLVGVVFVILASILTVMLHWTSNVVHEILNVCSTVAAMTSAWCFLGAAQWYTLAKMVTSSGEHGGGEAVARRLVVTPSGKFMAAVSVAVFFSLVFAVAVYCFSLALHLGCKKRMLKGSFTAVSLVMGLGWEHLFDIALDEAAEFGETPQGKQWLKVFLTFLLVIIVAPAWMVYILPKHSPELIPKYGNKQLSVFMCCGDCCDDLEKDDDAENKYGDLEEEGDEE